MLIINPWDFTGWAELTPRQKEVIRRLPKYCELEARGDCLVCIAINPEGQLRRDTGKSQKRIVAALIKIGYLKPLPKEYSCSLQKYQVIFDPNYDQSRKEDAK